MSEEGSQAKPAYTEATRERLLKILLSPMATEKSTNAAERYRQYVFKVSRDATKPEIKQAVEFLFEVVVEGVQTLNYKGKRKRFGQTEGQRNHWKKAYVKLQEGQEINFVGNE